MRHLEGQEYTKKKKAMKMSKSRKLENGKSDFTEAKASISIVQYSQTKTIEKFLLDSATWRKFVMIQKTSVVFACPKYLSPFDNKIFISL